MGGQERPQPHVELYRDASGAVIGAESTGVQYTWSTGLIPALGVIYLPIVLTIRVAAALGTISDSPPDESTSPFQSRRKHAGEIVLSLNMIVHEYFDGLPHGEYSYDSI